VVVPACVSARLARGATFRREQFRSLWCCCRCSVKWAGSYHDSMCLVVFHASVATMSPSLKIVNTLIKGCKPQAIFRRLKDELKALSGSPLSRPHPMPMPCSARAQSFDRRCRSAYVEMTVTPSGFLEMISCSGCQRAA